MQNCLQKLETLKVVKNEEIELLVSSWVDLYGQEIALKVWEILEYCTNPMHILFNCQNISFHPNATALIQNALVQTNLESKYAFALLNRYYKELGFNTASLEEFVLLYEGLIETQHLALPVLKRLDEMLRENSKIQFDPTSIDNDWWIVIIKRACYNQTNKKLILEFVMNHDFFCSIFSNSTQFVHLVDDVVLYDALEQGTYRSEFGEQVSIFFKNLTILNPRLELIQEIALLKNPVPALFMLQGISTGKLHISNDSLKILIGMTGRDKFSVWRSQLYRDLLHRLMLDIVLTREFASFDFSTISRLLSAIFSFDDDKTANKLRCWIFSSIGHEEYLIKVKEELKSSDCPIMVYFLPVEYWSDVLEFKALYRINSPYANKLETNRSLTLFQNVLEMLLKSKIRYKFPANLLDILLEYLYDELRHNADCSGDLICLLLDYESSIPRSKIIDWLEKLWSLSSIRLMSKLAPLFVKYDEPLKVVYPAVEESTFQYYINICPLMELFSEVLRQFETCHAPDEIMNFLAAILDNFDISSELRLEMVSKILYELEQNYYYSQKWPQLLDASLVIFHPKILVLNEDSSWEYFQSKGEQRTGMVLAASRKMREYLENCKEWTDIESQWIIDMITYSPDRDTTNIHQESIIASKLKDHLDYKYFFLISSTADDEFYVQDYKIRVIGYELLAAKTTNNSNITKRIFEKIKQVDFSVKMQYLKEKYLIQLWQGLFVLPLSKLEFSDLHNLLLKPFSPSVKIWIEWMIIRQGYFMEAVEKLKEFNQKPHVVSSLLFILLHSNLDSQFYCNSISIILPWTMHNHFNIRVMAQYLFMKHYRDHANSAIDFARFLESSSDCQKNFKKLDNYYLTGKFNPVLDLNFEFMFNGLHVIMNRPVSERISHRAFYRSEFNTKGTYQLEGATLAAAKGTQESFKEENQEISNLQKKILPWQSILESSGLDFTKRQKSTSYNCIIIASLLEKIPNLGGLCRTAEIFNIKSVVMDDLSVTKHAEFLATSVTSEKWIETIEIKKNNLQDYILELKASGYCICGLEQASESVQLQDCEFSSNVAILLGTEKRGIPPNLLNLCDSVIEIPQFGITRSLNVHVSASLMIWEYVKQQMKRID